MVKDKFSKFADWVDGHQKKAALAVVSLIVLGFFVHGLQFTGPVYLADETGYLTKAAAIAGHVTDTASSYSAGYSLFLAPAFLFFSDATQAWRAVMLINALLWGGVFYLLFHLLLHLFPKEKPSRLLLVSAACALYPSWITMSGYAFSTPATVFVFMLSLLLLVTLDKKHPARYAWFGVTAGYLYWIHTVGIVFIAVAILFLMTRLFVDRNYRNFLSAVTPMIVMVIVYTLFIQNWLNDIMTPAGQIAWSHYGGVVSALLDHRGLLLRTEVFWRRFLSMLMGQAGQLLIASFGIVAYAVFAQRGVFKFRKKEVVRSTKRILDNKQLVVLAVSILSVLGAIIFGSLVLAIHQSIHLPIGSYFIVYGRYSELFVLPLIAIGLLVSWRSTWPLKAAYITLILGSISYILAAQGAARPPEQTVNIPSFWPVVLYNDWFMFWFAVGSLGILVVAFMVRFVGKRALIVLLPVMMLCVNYQNMHHHTLLAEGSRGSALTGFIDSMYKKNSCVGFEYNPKSAIDGGLDNNRLRLLAYENFTHKFQRMSLERWKSSCDGPFITSLVYSAEDLEGAQYIAREELSGLYVIVKKDDISRTPKDYPNGEGIYISSDNPECVKSGCFIELPNEMKTFSMVGDVVDDKLVAQNVEGVLTFGPYTNVAAGNYVLEFNADVTDSGTSSVELELQSNRKDKQTIQHLSDKLTTDGVYRFSLSEPVEGFQVIITVHKGATAEVREYTIKRV